MSRLARNSEPEARLASHRVFFATTKTSMGTRLFQSERNAGLLIDVLRSLVVEHKFKLLDFVVMPDHLHLLIEVDSGTTIEKAMQWIKGRFSFRLKKEHGYLGEVWQRGFHEVQVMGCEQLDGYKKYIAENPLKAGLVRDGEEYPFCFRTLARKRAVQGYSGSTVGVSRSHDA